MRTALFALALTLSWIVVDRHEQASPGLLIRGGTVVDGSGRAKSRADVRILGDKIAEIGSLTPKAGERVIDATGLVVCPGFIDTHSHADGGILENPSAELMVRQGITTAIGGQDGSSPYPLAEFLGKLERNPPAINLACFAGHGTVRSKVMGSDFKRHASEAELVKMRALVDQEMRAGALGLSTGLEYDPGHYSDTAEVIELAKVAAGQGGIYISHMRNEDNEAFKSVRELIEIARKGRIPAQISHIKLGSKKVWNHAEEMLRMMGEARAKGLDITADVYPYLFWQSTITVLIPTRNWADRSAWAKGLDDIGGPGHVVLSSYSPDRSWEGLTLEQIAGKTGKDAVGVIQEIVDKTHNPEGRGKESVIVTAMTEGDLRKFIADPHIMLCTDGGLKPSHPRAAGSFPRILGHYVRDEKVLTLEKALRKMTSLPAKRMELRDRGLLRAGYKADIVLFDPNRIRDTATVKNPASPPEGLATVIVNGQIVLENGWMTGARPGKALRRQGREQN